MILVRENEKSNFSCIFLSNFLQKIKVGREWGYKEICTHTTTKIGSTLGCKISEKNLTKKWVEGGLSRGFNS